MPRRAARRWLRGADACFSRRTGGRSGLFSPVLALAMMPMRRGQRKSGPGAPALAACITGPGPAAGGTCYALFRERRTEVIAASDLLT